MDNTIHFRTRFTREKWVGSASRHTSGRSAEASEIRIMGDNDDARDIVWKKSTGINTYTRSRLINPSIDVTVVYHRGIYDTIKEKYVKQIWKYIEHSCLWNGDTYSYEEITGSPSEHSPFKKKNHLIFIVSSSVSKQDYIELGKLFPWNDVIFILLFQPIELEPGWLSIFESRIPNKRYYTEIQKRIQEIQKIIHLSQKSNILVRTNDNIVIKLNHFFKYRYG